VKFSQFMASPRGRITRVLAGAILIAVGIAMKSAGGYVVAVIGALPLAAGIFDVCILAPLFGMPFTGKAIRAFKR
jgi:hypothetical protein